MMRTRFKSYVQRCAPALGSCHAERFYFGVIAAELPMPSSADDLPPVH
jgi:hypothetical protein